MLRPPQQAVLCLRGQAVGLLAASPAAAAAGRSSAQARSQALAPLASLCAFFFAARRRCLAERWACCLRESAPPVLALPPGTPRVSGLMAAPCTLLPMARAAEWTPAGPATGGRSGGREQAAAKRQAALQGRPLSWTAALPSKGAAARAGAAA